MKFLLLKWRVALIALALAALGAAIGYGLWRLYSHGVEVGSHRTEAAHEADQRELRHLAKLHAQTQRTEAVATHTAQLDRSAKAAGQQAKKQRGLDDFFNRLEAASNVTLNAAQTPFKSAVDAPSCILPDERLRIWRAANAGMDARAGFDAAESDATGISPAAAPPSAPASQRGDSGVGAQPPARGQDVPRTGGASVQPAIVFRAPVPADH